jgi:hypothetical protein
MNFDHKGLVVGDSERAEWEILEFSELGDVLLELTDVLGYPRDRAEKVFCRSNPEWSVVVHYNKTASLLHHQPNKLVEFLTGELGEPLQIHGPAVLLGPDFKGLGAYGFDEIMHYVNEYTLSS